MKKIYVCAPEFETSPAIDDTFEFEGVPRINEKVGVEIGKVIYNLQVEDVIYYSKNAGYFTPSKNLVTLIYKHITSADQ